ncbi:OsmC family protein [bacterium]|nr:OsmC family protein [bacterium]MBU1071839.1 OsmC family protein [bacterium]MBU1495097.1 OsmC family protein [Actinomycetota bacterium]MBU1676901.1 OsmC family protein [bacterium]
MTEHVVTWEGKRRFTGRTPDGRTGAFDIPVEKGGDGSAPSPMEAVLHALAACGALDVVAILEKMRCPPESLRVEIGAERAEDHPRVYTAIRLKYVVTGDVPEQKLARAIKLSSGTFCSVGAMLGKTAEISYAHEVS